MGLGCGLDQFLKMGASKEVSQVDKFAVILILNVDDSPSILTATNLLAAYDDRFLRPNDCKRNDVLKKVSSGVE